MRYNSSAQERLLTSFPKSSVTQDSLPAKVALPPAVKSLLEFLTIPRASLICTGLTVFEEGAKLNASHGPLGAEAVTERHRIAR